MPFSVPSTLEKHMRKCVSINNGSTANINQNSNSSSGNLNNGSSTPTPTTEQQQQQLLNNNNLLGLAGFTGTNLLSNSLLNMVNSARNSPNSANNSLLSSLTNAALLSANEQLLDT